MKRCRSDAHEQTNETQYINDRTVALDLLQKHGTKYVSHVIVGNEVRSSLLGVSQDDDLNSICCATVEERLSSSKTYSTCESESKPWGLTCRCAFARCPLASVRG